jgi:hypothetical protein
VPGAASGEARVWWLRAGRGELRGARFARHGFGRREACEARVFIGAWFGRRELRGTGLVGAWFSRREFGRREAGGVVGASCVAAV